MMKCDHKNFEADVAVNRVTEGDAGPVIRFMADVRVKCAECGTPSRFIGLPAGMDYNSPCVSVDACEARMPIAPKGEILSELEGGVHGFSVRRDRSTVCPGFETGGTGPKCCDRAGEYNGFGSDGPTLFTCPKHCGCHD